MFETITGTCTGITNQGLIDTSKNFAIDYFKNWRAVISLIDLPITGNDSTNVFFENTFTGTPEYSIEFMTRAFLAGIDDQIANVSLVPNSLLKNKIDNTKRHLESKVYAYMRNQFGQYDDPLALILNPHEMQLAFAYYCLAEIFSDLLLIGKDINGYKEEKYRNAYRDILKDSMSLLAIDSDGSGSISASEKVSSPSDGGFFSR